MQSPSLSPGFSWFELIAPPGQHTLTLQLLHEATTFSVPLLLLEETVENCSEPAPLCLGAELPLPSCQELEPLVCQLLQVESEILCLQLALNQFSLQLERQGPQASNFLSPWHAQVFAAAAPRLEQKEGLQARLFQELKELSRKKPTQYSSYLHHHQALEAAYGKQLQSLLERDP